VQTILQDLRYALRQLRRAPGFAFSVILVLALGIGANAAMFTVLESTLFRPLPYKHASRLVTLQTTTTQATGTLTRLADLQVWRERSRALEQIAYFDSGSAYLLSQNATQKIGAVVASPNLFGLLGTAPALGRTFTSDEQQPGKNQVAVLSDIVWHTQFHADPKVLGETVRIDNTPVTIIGVMPAGFSFPLASDQSPAQVWRPVSLEATDLGRGPLANGYQAIARLRDGARVEAASAELDAIQQQLIPLYPEKFAVNWAPAHVHAVDYRRSLTENNQRTALLALLGAVATLWLIACANVACLMLARTASRRRELAVRSALGATGWRIMRQTLVESLLLSVGGMTAGLAFAFLALRFFRHSLTTLLSPHLMLQPDGRVMAGLTGLTVLSAILFGLAPAWMASGTNVEQALRTDGAQAGTGRHQHRLQRILVVCELSLTLALLVSCGLLLRTVLALREVPLGFRTDHVFVLEPNLPGYKYDAIDINRTILKPLLARFEAIPGVNAAAVTTIAPLDTQFASQLSLDLTGNPKDVSIVSLQAAGPELQKVLRFGMVRGRYFNEQDTASDSVAAVVNTAFAKLYERYKGDVAHLNFRMSANGSAKPRWIRIIGVVDDMHQVGIAEASFPEIDINAAQMRPEDGFYQPTLQAHVQILVRSNRDTRDLIPELQRTMVQFNPDLAGTDIRTMDQIVDDAMGSQLLAAHLLEALGALALIVALAGLYSLLAYLVTLRTRELGLRLALGAQREDILNLILRGAAILLVTGITFGIALSLLTARLLHSFLFGVKPYDPITLVSAPLLLILVGALAAWLPARRAAQLEPMQALRTE
jgi:predicted permease